MYGDTSYGVASDVVCSTIIGNARASARGMDNNMIPRFLCSENWFCLEKVEEAYMVTSSDVNALEGGVLPSDIGLTSSGLPEAKTPISGKSSNTGVSTLRVFNANVDNHNPLNWYAVRTTYGREKKAYDFIIEHNGTAFLPTITVEKKIKNKKKRIEVSRIPNIFFVYGTEETVKQFVYDNVNLPYLRFYYKHIHSGAHISKEPLIVPEKQIKSLKIICDNENVSNILLLQEEVAKFKKGEKVIVKEGDFEGVTGIVARYHGQQRVGIVIDGLLTAITAYVPNAFLKRLE